MTQNTSNFRCTSCSCTRVSTVRMPEYCVHHAALRCAGCDRFIKWSPKPEKQSHQLNADRINHLLTEASLNWWETDFLTAAIRKKKKLSPRQAECLAKIEAKV